MPGALKCAEKPVICARILHPSKVRRSPVRMRTFISFSEALTCVLSHARTMPAESVSLSEALNRTLAEPVTAREDVPPFPSSAMDGFAVRSQDVHSDGSATLRVSGHIAAGDPGGHFVEPGTCMEIMTGAPFPDGADAVAPIEWVSGREGDVVSFSRFPVRDKHVRPAAEDIAEGDQVFSGGEVITPALAGMLATLGMDPVRVRRSPIVRVISTGNEIVAPSDAIGPGQIRNSNGPSLRAQVIEAGGVCAAFEHAPDDPEAIAELLNSSSASDLIIFSGGVSVGDHDHVRRVLDEAGAEMLFWKVRQRPGKPLAFGRLGEAVFLGLPGNPVSSAMCFEIYGRPLIERMVERRSSRTPLIPARLGRTIRKVDGLHFFTRGIVSVGADGSLAVVDTGPQRSNLYGSVVKANCIVHLPEAGEEVAEGSLVEIQLLPWAELQGVITS